jgi:hypothetical protein
VLRLSKICIIIYVQEQNSSNLQPVICCTALKKEIYVYAMGRSMKWKCLGSQEVKNKIKCTQCRKKQI